MILIVGGNHDDVLYFETLLRDPKEEIILNKYHAVSGMIFNQAVLVLKDVYTSYLSSAICMHVIEKYHVIMVFCVGKCRSISDELRCGDIVLSKKVVFGDVDMIDAVKGTKLGQVPGFPTAFYTDPNLLSILSNSLERLGKTRTYESTFLSSSVYTLDYSTIDRFEETEEIKGEGGAIVVDSETAGVALAANLLDVPIEDSYFYDGYYLEGVVNNQKGVCSGMAKLFLCLCALEGIPCEYVVGNSISNNIGHAWNKVMIDGAWYIVDVTNGHAVYGDKYYLSHAYFLLSDDEYLFATPSIEPNTNKDIKCTNTYDVFSKQYIDGLPIAVNNFNEAVDLFSAISKKEYFNNTIMLEIKFNYPITSIEDDVKSILKEIGFYNRFGYSEINDSYLIFLYNNYLYNN